MQATLELDFLPPTLNEVIRMCKDSPHVYARYKRRYGDDCALCALGMPQFTGKVWLSFEWRIKTLRRDPDNTAVGAKCLMDALVKIGIIKDDSAEIIQPPIIHTWKQSKQEGVLLVISDRPIYELRLAAQPIFSGG